MKIMETSGIFLLFCFYLCGICSTDTTELLTYSSVLHIELKESVTFPLLWKQHTSTTLTVSHEVKDVLTEVLWVNDTDARISNTWENKAMVSFYNESDTIFLNVTLTDVTTEDEGRYKIKLEEDGEEYIKTIYNAGNFEIETYALPIYVKIEADQTDVDEHTEIKVTCSGNIGRPVGELYLLQSSDENLDYFYTVEKVILSDTPGIQDNMLPNGTFYIQHEFYRNISRSDNGTSYKCELVHFMSEATIVDSDTLYILVNCRNSTFTRDAMVTVF